MKGQFSIIIPVWNEASTINQALWRLKRIDSAEDFEIIVVDGNPDQSTIHAISRPGIVSTVAERGRGAQMNKGASIAFGEILLFLHADTILKKGAFSKILTALKPADVVGGAFDLGIRSHRKIFRVIEKGVFLRTRLTHIPYGDQAIFIKRDFFHHMGGFKELPIMEDVEIIRRIKMAGKKISIIPSKVYTSPRRWEKEGIIRCTFRNWVLITLYFCGVSPERLARFYKFG